MKCNFCGFDFDINAAKSGCSGCPMGNSCKKVKCPNCNFEMYPEPEHKLIKKFGKWSKNIWKR